MNLHTKVQVETESGEHRVPHARVYAEGRPRATTDRCASSPLRSLAKCVLVQRNLRKLIDCGLLTKKGGGAATYYTPTDKAIANWPPLGCNLANPANFNLEATELNIKKQELDTKKQELDTKKQELPDAIRAKIAEQGRKADPNEINKLVLEILSLRPMTNAELANHLGRKPDYVRRTFLKPLLAQGQIRSSNPERPTDPNLKYSAVRER